MWGNGRAGERVPDHDVGHADRGAGEAAPPVLGPDAHTGDLLEPEGLAGEGGECRVDLVDDLGRAGPGRGQVARHRAPGTADVRHLQCRRRLGPRVQDVGEPLHVLEVEPGRIRMHVGTRHVVDAEEEAVRVGRIGHEVGGTGVDHVVSGHRHRRVRLPGSRSSGPRDARTARATVACTPGHRVSLARQPRPVPGVVRAATAERRTAVPDFWIVTAHSPFLPDTQYTPAADRYDEMPYHRVGASGLHLPAVSLGLWHNFGDDKPLEQPARDPAPRVRPRHHPHRHRQQLRPAGRARRTNFGKLLRAGPRAPPRRADHLVQGRLLHVARARTVRADRASTCWSSLDQSLARIGLDYFDIFYSHRFDPDTPLEETMGALDTAVRSGRALYAGISSRTPPRTPQRAAAILAGPRHSVPDPPAEVLDLNRWIEDGPRRRAG